MPKSMSDVVIGAAKQNVAVLLHQAETKQLAAELLQWQAKAAPPAPDFYAHLLTTLTAAPLPADVRDAMRGTLYDAFLAGRDWQEHFGKPGADCVPTAWKMVDALMPLLEAAIRRVIT